MYPVKVTVRDTPKSLFLDDYINKKAQKLDHFNQGITLCRVIIDMPQKHKHQGKLFRASITLNVRGKELIVNRKLDEDVYIAVTEAFDAIERKLEDYSHRRVDNIRRRQRNYNGSMEEIKSNGKISANGKTSSNDELYTDDDSDYEDISLLLRDENLFRG
jgi:ribosomal subunit interface protein